MKGSLISLLAAILFIGGVPQDETFDSTGFGQPNYHEAPTAAAQGKGLTTPEGLALESDDFSNEPVSDPIEIDWRVLVNIDYELKYFEELEMEIYAPVFSEAVQELDGKEVIIEGYVIPFDGEEEVLTLSFFPYASCFFCGNASPASVMSLYIKEKDRRYKVDDFKKFRGVLHLNEDDPKEFYYILRDAEEV